LQENANSSIECLQISYLVFHKNGFANIYYLSLLIKEFLATLEMTGKNKIYRNNKKEFFSVSSPRVVFVCHFDERSEEKSLN